MQPDQTTARLVVSPLTEVVAWSDFARPVHGTRYWEAFARVAIHLPGANLRQVQGDKWRVLDAEHIEIDAGFRWDGASGPALTTPANVMASLVHDIVCMKGVVSADLEDWQPWMGAPRRAYAVESYLQRHALYWRIGRRQGMGRWRAGMHFAGLMLGNRFWSLAGRLKRKAP